MQNPASENQNIAFHYLAMTNYQAKIIHNNPHDLKTPVNSIATGERKPVQAKT
jgi:hypothetical protein